MKRILILFMAIVTVCVLFACSSPTFEEDDDAMIVSFRGAEWVLIPDGEDYEIEGVVRSFYRKNSGPYAVFCGTMTLQYELSEEEFYEEYGEPSPIMNELDEVIHGSKGNCMATLKMKADTIVPLSENKQLFRALSTVKAGDEVYLEGETVSVDRAGYKGEKVKQLSNIVLVTYAEINGKVYGE
jgi:hypothetical protein